MDYIKVYTYILVHIQSVEVYIVLQMYIFTFIPTYKEQKKNETQKISNELGHSQNISRVFAFYHTIFYGISIVLSFIFIYIYKFVLY